MDKGEYENELKQVIGDTKVIVGYGRARMSRENIVVHPPGASVVVNVCGEACLTPPKELNLFFFVVVRRCTQNRLLRSMKLHGALPRQHVNR